MSQKKPMLCLAAGAMALCAMAVHADESGISYPAKIGGKLGIGLLNVATGIVELPKALVVESTNEGVLQGMTVGWIKGFGNMLGRSFLGMLDVVSFPIPTKPLITPPVVFQNFGEETSYGTGWESY